jgi:tetratricopeptide (TPR) repeat protein
MLRDHPIVGVGIGHFGLNHLTYQSELFASGQFNAYFDNASVISEGHNDFLNWGAMTGILGLLGYITLCVGTLSKGWHSSALKHHAPQLYLALVGYIVAMFFISVTSYTAPALFFWLLLGMLWARSDLAKTEWMPRLGLRHALSLCLVILLIVDGNVAWREVRGGLIEAHGDKLMEEHDLWLADKEYQQAITWNPRNSGLRKKHATTLFLIGDLQQSLSELEEAKRFSGDLGIYLLEGEIRTRLANLDHAVTVYQQITASFPNLVGPHFILGQIYQLQGKQDNAEIEFRRVLNIKPSPFKLSLTVEKVELQKRIVREYLHEPMTNPAQAVDSPGAPDNPD